MDLTSKKIIIGVGVLIKSDNKVLLVKRLQDPGKGKWSIPGGRLKFGEKLRDAAIREIEEETGLKIEIVRLLDVVDIFVKDRKGKVKDHYVIIDFEGKITGGELKASSDASEVKWVDVSEINEYELTDSTAKFLREYL